MTSTRHAGFAGYLLRARLNPGPAREDGSVVLVFDATLRVAFHPVPRGDLVLEAQVAEMPTGRQAADRLLQDVLEAAGRRPAHEDDGLALAGSGRRLLLQQRVAAEVSAQEFESRLGTFLDALSAWRARLGTL
jgi:hypothetical protein